MSRTVWHVYRTARAENADIYHFHDPELIPVGLLLQAQGKRVIYDVHEDYVTAIRQKTYLPYSVRMTLAGLFAAVEARVTRPFHIVLAERYYQARFPEGTPVLNYPLTSHFPPTRAQPNRNLALLYSGVVSADRGALVHSRLVALLKDIEVYVVGRCPPELAREMRRLAGEGAPRLHIEGEGSTVRYDRILEYYRQGRWLAGLALFPPSPHYLHKELTKFFEYMGAGIPILCSNFPTWRTLVKNTGAGLCVDPQDPAAIAQAITYLARHPEETERMSANGRQAFETRYNWESEAAKLLDVYARLL
jgi:glycosyltransferase involved in cell wall biosynthesis